MCSTTVILTVSTGDAVVYIYAVYDARLKVRFQVDMWDLESIFFVALDDVLGSQEKKESKSP